MDDSDTTATFPTYEELTRTRAWANAPTTRITTVTFEPDHGSARYTESAVLGAGGMGKVVLARDSRIGREVAVKVLHPERTRADELRARFLREAQVQGQLEHPSIVPVYDIDSGSDGGTFFTMRRVLGKTLQVIIEELRAGTSDKRYTQRELLQAFATVCLAVDYAHSRGVVHRDLKPANIMLGEFGEVYVLDWGIARVLDASATELTESASRLSQPGITLGTPLYMAPEQVGDPDVNVTADVFSLGAILFEILTFERLRTAHTLSGPVEARPSVRTPKLRIAPELEAICVTATQFDAAARFPSARALQEHVARYLEGDRELEQRRVLANEHATRARLALGADEPQDDLAMLELARALALDPTNIEHVAMLSEVLRSQPPTTPPEIQQHLDAAAAEVVRTGTKYTTLGLLSWFLFLPLVFWLGVRRVDYLVAVAVPVLLTVVLGMIAATRPVIGRSYQYAMLGTTVISGVMLSRLFGPLILVPTVLASWAIVIQTNPARLVRRLGLAGSVLGIAMPVVLELAGVLPASYVFDDGFAVVPQLAELAEVPTIAFLGLASVVIAIIPSVFVARLRERLAESERRELLHSWRLRRLGDSILNSDC
jgi:serine/threonine-protein kinase